MSVRVTFYCDGCDARSHSAETISRKLGERMTPLFVKKLPWNVEEVAPDGWVVDDPYTGCCYCPDCWDSIEKEEDKKHE